MQKARVQHNSIPLAMLLLAVLFYSATVPSPYMAFRQDDIQVSITARATVAHAYESELRWLESTQRPDGAITFNASRNTVVPYFANLAALPLLDKDPGAVRLYMEWYVERLNHPDRFGLYGTIYDRYYEDGAEWSTQDYDSADSYAATFLSLVRAYQVRTGDTEWVLTHMTQIESVAQVIIALQDKDGLVWAKPNHKMKYLMDNSENYRGLMDWSLLLDELGETDRAAQYRASALAVQNGVETKLWDEGRQAYLWGIGPIIKRVPRTGVWYPDNIAQVYPAVFGLVSWDSERAITLYKKVSQQFPDWPEYAKGDPYPWAIIAYAAAKIGDVDRAARFLEVTDSRFIKAGRPAPWHSMESAFYLMTCQTIDQQLGGDLADAASAATASTLVEERTAGPGAGAGVTGQGESTSATGQRANGSGQTTMSAGSVDSVDRTETTGTRVDRVAAERVPAGTGSADGVRAGEASNDSVVAARTSGPSDSASSASAGAALINSAQQRAGR